MQKILITGAAGRVGTAIRPFLRTDFSLRLFDRVAVPDTVGDEEVMIGDLTRPADVRAAVEGTTGVVHLACVHGLEIGFEQTLDANYRAMLYLLEETKRCGVQRFVYTSSHHVVGNHRSESFVDDNALLAPDGFYG
jgi:uronate dehydrogenase